MDEGSQFRRRTHLVASLVALAFLALALRLFVLQRIRGPEYAARAVDNWLEQQRIPPLRGYLFDRNGQVLAKNRPSFDLMVTPRFTNDAVIARAISLLDLSVEESDRLRNRIQSREGPARHRAWRLLRDLDRDQFARIATEQSTLAGIRATVGTQRVYPEGKTAAHVIGYMNEISAQEIVDAKDHEYFPGALVGRFGVEKMVEAELRGAAGTKPHAVDARGAVQPKEIIQGLGLASTLSQAPHQQAQPGRNVYLTLDLALQKAAEQALRSHPSGAAVVLEAQTGRVLAMVSKPTFDPNQMTGRLTPAMVQRFEENPFRPLIDKALREDYFPGSVYKIVAAIAALEKKFVDPRQKFRCTGSHELGRHVFRCPRAHGWVDLEQAIVQSCNVYFYRMAELVGMDSLAEVARNFGFATPTGIGLNGEVGGFVPTKNWYLANSKEGFRLGFSLNAAIGQGSTKVTVLQMALAYAAIGNGGRLFVPKIVERMESADGQRLSDFQPEIRRQLQASPATLALLKRALRGVVENPKGTAFSARLRGPVSVAGKTGTAQVRGSSQGAQDVDHAWFVAFAPADSPVISVAVLVEHGGQGSKVAAPIAMEIIDSYFRSGRQLAHP